MNKSTLELIRCLFECQYDFAAIAIEQLKKEQKHIYVFGAGVAGKLTQKVLEDYGIHTFAFVDNNPAKVGTELDDIQVISFDDMRVDCYKTVLIGSVAFHHELVEQCFASGIPESDICFADFVHYVGKDETRNYFYENIDAIANIFEHCTDEESKQLFVSNILYQFNRDRRHYHCHLSPLSEQYYDTSIMGFGPNDVYLDCGAKDGDTTIAFDTIRQGSYSKIISFEPDEMNYNMLKKNTKHMPNIICENAGVGEVEGTLRFNGERGGHSSFDDGGKLEVKIVPIDNFFCKNPTFIKMDIEGFELNALKGARKTITELKPKLAICVYHKPRDIVELAHYILTLRSDYKVYYRLYRDFGHDLVCYCV